MIWIYKRHKNLTHWVQEKQYTAQQSSLQWVCELVLHFESYTTLTPKKNNTSSLTHMELRNYFYIWWEPTLNQWASRACICNCISSVVFDVITYPCLDKTPQSTTYLFNLKKIYISSNPPIYFFFLRATFVWFWIKSLHHFENITTEEVLNWNDCSRSGDCLNKKDGLTRYGNSHVKDKTS